MPRKHAWANSTSEDLDGLGPPRGGGEPVKAAVKGTCSDANMISLSRKIIFCAPTVATLPFVAMWGMYGNKNYQAFGASLAIIALFTALARSLDVVSDPLISYWTDSARCDRLPRWLRGRRKPFMFFGCFFYSMFLWLLLNPPYVGGDLLAIHFGAFYTLYFLANTITCIPYDALAPELSEDSEQRTGLFFVANLFDGAGTFIALGLPIAMTSFATRVWTYRNELICKTDVERAAECLAGRSCGTFFSRGHPGAYAANGTLQALFATLGGDTTTTADPARDCAAWYRLRTTNASVLLPMATAEQNDGFCDCMVACADGCEVANKRTGFMLVGTIFALWFVVTMVTAVWRVPEKLARRKAPPPMVPAIRNALNNRPFCILLPAWLCDAFVASIVQSLVPYFVEAVVAPAYQTMEAHGRDCYKSSPDFVHRGQHWIGEAGRYGSPTWDSWCDTDNVIAMCGFLALVTALLVLPIWNLIVARVGKVRTWLVWTLTMAVTNFLFLFVPKGGVYYLWFVAAMNGAPLGAKFLADAILADIIDYDEFRTGTRSEATYFMFKSFLPKIIQIPASAVPIALLGSFNYVAPIGGKVQDQPQSVSMYMRCVVGCGFIVSVIAYFLKRKYPLLDEKVHELAQGLQEHKADRWAMDPVVKVKHKPMVVPCEEQEIVWLFDHFPDFAPSRLRTALSGDSSVTPERIEAHLRDLCGSVSRSVRLQLVVAIAFCVCSISGSVGTVNLLWSAKLQFVPTLFVVCIGISISCNAFCVLRKRAADRLSTMAACKDMDVLVAGVQLIIGFQAEFEDQEKRATQLQQVVEHDRVTDFKDPPGRAAASDAEPARHPAAAQERAADLEDSLRSAAACNADPARHRVAEQEVVTDVEDSSGGAAACNTDRAPPYVVEQVIVTDFEDEQQDPLDGAAALAADRPRRRAVELEIVTDFDDE